MRVLAPLRRLAGRGRGSLVCRQVAELMTEYLEGALPARTRGRFEAHFSHCPPCLTRLDQMRATVAAIGRLRTESVPPAVLDRLVGLYRRFCARRL